MLAALQRLAVHPRLPWILAVLLVVLCAPIWLLGFTVDDWVHQAILFGVEPVEPQRSPVHDLFAFFDGDVERNRAMKEQGILPWWSELDLRARMWRPLTGLTHVLDHAVAPGSAAFAHAQSLLWLIALCLLAWRLFVTVHGPGFVAGLAALLYAVDETHGIPVGWLANRNALVAGVLGTAAVLLYVRARRGGGAAAMVGAVVVFAAGLLAAEAGIAATAWMFAFAVALDEGSWRARIVSLAPFAAVVVVWRGAYNLLGYGVDGSGLYLDPVRSPLRYVAALPGRAVVLLADQLGQFPSMLVAMAPVGVRAVVIGVLLVPVAAVAGLLWRELGEAREARFWMLGSALSLLPVAATFPMGRVLGFVGLGGAALVAMLAERVWVRGTGGRFARPVATGFLVLHLPVAALLLPLQCAYVHILGAALFDRCEDEVPRDPAIRDKTVVFVNSNEMCTVYVDYERAVTGAPRPADVRLLASGFYDLDVTGIDAHTLELTVHGGMHSVDADALLRSADDPLPVGWSVTLPGQRVEVVGATAEGLVERVRVRFDVPLRDPSLLWFATRARAPAERTGEVVKLPRAF